MIAMCVSSVESVCSGSPGYIMGCLLPIEFPEFFVHPNWSLISHMIFQTFSNVLVSFLKYRSF